MKWGQKIDILFFWRQANASVGCELAVTARIGIGSVRFRKCEELFLENKFPLKMKGKFIVVA